MKRIAILLVMGIMLMPATALAGQGQEVCGPLDSGKIDTSGNPASVVVTAPDGFLIDEYCVKAGSDESTDGAVVYVIVDPPKKTVTITHPSGKDVSHYSVSYVKVVTTTTVPETSTTVPETTTTVPETTTTDPETTTTVPVTTTDPETTVPTTTPSELPFTGIDTGAFIVTALVLLMSGGLLLVGIKGRIGD